jgi:hypothetical protein
MCLIENKDGFSLAIITHHKAKQTSKVQLMFFDDNFTKKILVADQEK